MKQHILSEGKLLNEDGLLIEAGYATSLVKEYNRSQIKAKPLRIKEWDYYYVGNEYFGMALTVADNSYMGLGSVSFFNFETKFWKTKSVITLFPKGKTNLPSSSKIGDVMFYAKNIRIELLNDGKTRILKCFMKKFYKKQDFTCEVVLSDQPQESMVIATPFCIPKYFYYNQKINCIKASGKMSLGAKQFIFEKENSFGVLDWGRGVWTYENTWHWASMSGTVYGQTIGFNFGYGFGDTSKATENMIFYDGKSEKVEHVTFDIKRDKRWNRDYLKPWTITSNDKKVNLVFEPIFDRNDKMNLFFLKSDQHQVFGRFSGSLVYNNQTIEIKDLIGFAERVSNKW